MPAAAWLAFALTQWTCLVWLSAPAFSQASERSAPPREKSPAELRAKPAKRPLLRMARAQYCLSELGFYQGEWHGRANAATLRALRRFRAEKEIRGQDDVARDFALHAQLWRLCQPAWARAVGAATTTLPGLPRAPAPASPPPAVASAAELGAGRACLPAELKDVLVRAQGPRREIETCELPCLPRPAGLDADDARNYERRHGVQWCRQCVTVSASLPLEEIERIERAGRITLCPEPRRIQRARSGEPGRVMIEQQRLVRSLFPRDGRAVERHGHVAVIVANSRHVGRQSDRATSERDAAAMHAVLTERLGYRGDRIIELRNASRAELEQVFGTASRPQGDLAARLKPGAATNVLVYVSGLGAIVGDDGEAVLLASDGNPRKEGESGLALATLFQNLTRIGAAAVTVILEVDFAADPETPVVPPNVPVATAQILPKLAQRGLTVMTAADRDQRPLEDTELGLSLFTRHLVAGLAGAADAAPVGNGDGTIDTAEAFVYAAHRTAIAARKTYGVLQKPGLSHGRATPLGRIGGAGP